MKIKRGRVSRLHNTYSLRQSDSFPCHYPCPVCPIRRRIIIWVAALSLGIRILCEKATIPSHSNHAITAVIVKRNANIRILVLVSVLILCFHVFVLFGLESRLSVFALTSLCSLSCSGGTRGTSSLALARGLCDRRRRSDCGRDWIC